MPHTRLFNSRIDMNELWWSGTQRQWRDALTYYWTLVKTDHIPIEKYFKGISMSDIEKMSIQEFYDFLYNKYFFGKYTAANRLATTRKHLSRYPSENRMDELARIQQALVSFDVNDTEKGLKIAQQIHGLGTAGASGLLAILLPQNFGTVDQFVVKALASINRLPEHQQILQMKPDSLTPKDGLVLIKIMKAKAIKLNSQFCTNEWSPRALDKILWSKDR